MAALSLLLIAVGAILAFAVNYVVEGAELTTIGLILMGVGAVGFIAGLFTEGFSSMKTTSTKQVSGDGRTVVEEQKTSAV